MPFDPQLSDVAERFVQFVTREAHMPVIVCDETATIVRATLRERIGAHHPGARRILDGAVREYLVTAEMEAADPRARQGCNSPIQVDGRTVGTFGVAGPVAVARPIAHLAAAVLGGWIRELEQRRRLHRAADEVVAGVAGLTGRVEEAARGAAGVERRMGEAIARATERAAATDEILGAVQRIAAQSRTLAINGSVEASRAGDAGRAFAVVAREMLALAEDARASARRIQGALGDVRTSLGGYAAALEATGRSEQERLAAMGAVAGTAGGLRDGVARLAASFDGRDDGDTPVDDAFWEMTGRFLELVARESGRPVIVCDGRGVIVRATDRARLGQPHAGAQRILRGEADEVAIGPEEAARSTTVREGCNCPVAVAGRRVGTFAVTGPVEVTRPLARVAAGVLATRVREQRSRALLQGAIDGVLGAVDALSARTRAAGEEATRRGAEMATAGREVADRLDAAEAVASAVQQISQQSRIIAVNGSVEAAGVGGRQAFSNVARDMLRLADEAHRAGKAIGQALLEIREAVRALTEAAALQAQGARAQAGSAAAVLAGAEAMRGTLQQVVGTFAA